MKQKKSILLVVGVVLLGIVLAVVWPGTSGLVKNKKSPVILLRSGWQVENIGDVAHTPGFLALAEKYIPDAELIFWPYYGLLPESEVAMLKKRFLKLTIVQGTLSDDGKASTPELSEAIAKADIFVHNSGLPCFRGKKPCCSRNRPASHMACMA